MASISTDKRGNRRILFVDGDGKRKPIRVGKLPLKHTETLKRRIEHILAARLAGTAVDPETAKWMAELPDDLSAKLTAVGLVPKRGSGTMSEFVAAYIDGRKVDSQPSTITNMRQAERQLNAFFGATKRLRDVTPGDCDDFRRWLSTKIGDNTARRLLGRAKQFFRAAVRKRLIIENPFADMKGLSVQANRAREYFVDNDTAAKVLAACPDDEWRLLFALARYGGLRTPSEPLSLTWGDVDWERNRLRVTSVKTACHEGHGERWIPLFPELRPHLEAVFDGAAPGATHVITRYRDRNSNLRTQLERIAARAGVLMWEKPFQNLRSTRETELMETYPAHVVCSWLGNSETVARKHYLQVTDEHFEKAAQIQAQTPPAASRLGATAER